MEQLREPGRSLLAMRLLHREQFRCKPASSEVPTSNGFLPCCLLADLVDGAGFSDLALGPHHTEHQTFAKRGFTESELADFGQTNDTAAKRRNIQPQLHEPRPDHPRNPIMKPG